MIDLYKLGIFERVAQAGSFSAAADQLYMTQSAVSQHIKELESSLGQQLFQRGRRGVSLTPPGEILAKYSRQIFALVAEAEGAVANVEDLESGRVTIGATPGVSTYLLPDWMQHFRTRYPRLTVALQTGITSQIINDIVGQQLEIGIIEGEIDDTYSSKLKSLVLEEIEQMVVVGFKHPFWDRESIVLEDLHQQSFIVRQQNSRSRIWLDTTLQAHNITPFIGAEFDNLESIKRAVTVGICLSILPSYVVQSELEQHQLHALSIEGKPLTRTLKLIWNAQVQFSPVARAFLKNLQESYPIVQTILSP